MSFSNPDGVRSGGKILIGPRSVGLSELTLAGGRQAAWSMEAEEEYLVRVRAKAQVMAKDILAQAMEEAKQIKVQARDEGFREGQAKADTQLKQVLEQAAGQCAAVISSIEEQGRAVWQTHRGDLVMLLHVMVEKAIAVELDVHRRESMANLLDQAVDMIDAKRKVIIAVNPQDRGLIEDLLTLGKSDGDRLTAWKVKDDPRIEPGGLILECDHGMVDNTVASRKAGLREILDQLTLEENG
ncbi:FliH/SctL family protein [Desulfonatronum lacustre]|uniref:FliH/SctL family protein n=1 Tax=Desulfonatronum lacustre TaxID=66849 RepID=UPI00048EF910|nr:FliH/SctL family protein [Desulfonatronum lacustre]